MNCDDAFEYITDATRQHASELQWHLDMCPRCQRMKETLEPALSLLTAECHTTMTGDASPPHNSRLGRLFAGEDASFESRRIARKAAAKPQSIGRTVTQAESVWRRGAVVAFAGAAMLAAMLLMFSPGSDQHEGISPGVEMCLWQTREAAVEDSPRAILATCLSCHPTSP